MTDEHIRISIGTNHFPTLRQLPEGWEIEDCEPPKVARGDAYVLWLCVAIGIAGLLYTAWERGAWR